MKKENLKKIFFALFLMLFVPAVQAAELPTGSENDSETKDKNSTGSENDSETKDKNSTGSDKKPASDQSNTGPEKKKSFRDRVKEKGKQFTNSAREKGKKLANRARAAKDNINTAYRNRMEVRKGRKEAAAQAEEAIKAKQKKGNR